LSHLLYCLFHEPNEVDHLGLTGVDGQPIAIFSRHGLGAVGSMLSAPQLPPPDLASIMSYQRVINHFHHRRTVIPMRYGCVFAGEAEIYRFLEDRFDEYHELLEKLAGCDEMGIRVLLDNPAAGEEPATDLGKSNPALSPPDPVGTGKDYLLARRTHYTDRDQWVHEEKAIFDKIREPLTGLFVRSKMEKSLPLAGSHRSSCHMLSLYFLVKREEVDKFRQVFQAFASRCSTQVLLSGPWPPFNFVVPATP
jgi:hypothetical protein